MAKTVRLSESDRFLLETLGKFCVRARHSTWEVLTYTNDSEAISLMREMSPLLTAYEYRSLMEGWGNMRINSDEMLLNDAVENITQRLQQRVESF